MYGGAAATARSGGRQGEFPNTDRTTSAALGGIGVGVGRWGATSRVAWRHGQGVRASEGIWGLVRGGVSPGCARAEELGTAAKLSRERNSRDPC
jgi:hypothetical protein